MCKLTNIRLFICEIRYQCLYIFAGERDIAGDDSRKRENIYKQNGLPLWGVRIQPWIILILPAVNIINYSYCYL